MENLQNYYHKGFEEIKKTKHNGSEYWTARELAPVLGYNKWENFQKVIERAMLACKNSGHAVNDHFPELRKMIQTGKGAKREIIDYHLTRYACYLIVQNGDPRKPVIAHGQTYFAVQTRRQEEADYYTQLDEDNKRLVIRNDIKQWNQLLAEAAYKSGVITDTEYAQFQNAGYMGLYGGETVEDIHKRKNLKKNQRILDFMSSPELIANLFRISQTEEKLKNEHINNAETAMAAHHAVGKEVRTAIEKIGGTLPENIQTPEKSIDQVSREQVKKLISKTNKLMLDE